MFHDGDAWVKKERKSSIGSDDRTEVCELVGLYLLSELVPLIGARNKEIYRDDVLAVMHQANGQNMGRIRKD